MMNRREALVAMVALPTLARASSQTAPLGPMSIKRHASLKARGIDVRVYVRGEDVTDRCRFADDTPGHQRAELLKRDNIDGHFYIGRDGKNPAMEVVEGRDVEMRIVRA